MISKRRRLLGLLACSWAAVPLARGQQQGTRVHRIGFLIPAYASSYATRVEALRSGLRDLGHVEGRNFVFEFRVADGKYDRLPDLALELVRAKAEVIVAGGTPATRAAMNASATVPVVMAVAGDAVASGLIASLARPGGKVTGTTYFDPELHEKRLELLKEALPRVTRVGALINPANPQATGTTLHAIRRAAEALKIELSLYKSRSPEELEGAFSAMARKEEEAVTLVDDPMFFGNLREIADLARGKELPSIGAKELAEAGGLVGYGVDFLEVFRRAAYFVDRILKGTKPADLPVERATRFELVVNRRTARSLKITISPQLLARADRVIE